jgi:hypothetical protein
MTREEITNNVGYAQEKANLEYIKYRQEHGVNDPYMITEIDEAFDAGYDKGYQYAQTHPNWISVDENNLPPKLKGKQYTEYYFVYSSRGVQKMRYNYDRRDWQDECGMMFIAIQCVTHWMPLPQPPRKEE